MPYHDSMPLGLDLQNDVVSKSVLLVEDNPVLQKMALLHLQSCAQVEVRTANNGTEALEALSKQAYDLILIDIDMPDAGGLMTARAIRQTALSHGSKPPIVAIAAGTTMDPGL